MLQFLFILMLTINPATQTDSLFVVSDSLFNNDGVLYLGSQEGWRFHPGDDLNWANPGFDDSNWMFFKPSGLTEPIPDSLWNGYGWFRYRFAADSSAYAMTTDLYFYTYGAAEVYLDGKLVQKFGAFSTDPKREIRYLKLYDKTYPSVVLHPAESHVLAVRFSYINKPFGKHAGTFGFGIGLATDNLNRQIISKVIITRQFVYILGTMLFLIVLLHVCIYAFFPAERSNLYIAIVTFLLFTHIIVTYSDLFFELDAFQKVIVRDIPYIILFMAALSMFPFTINSLFNQRPHLIHKVLIWLFPVFALANFILEGFGSVNFMISVVFCLPIIFFSSKALIQAWKNKQKGVRIVAVAFLCPIIAVVTWGFYRTFTKDYRYEIHAVLNYLIYGSIPLGLTVFMASRFRDLYTNLEQKVKERTRALNQSLEELKSTQAQLIQSEKMASLGALTAGIAHEIQNPLNFVNNFSEISNEMMDEMKGEMAAGNWQLATQISEEVKQNLEKIKQHGKRADAIVKGMLQHSRTNTGQKEPTNINALADEYLRLGYHGMRAKDKSFNADFKTDFDPNLPKVTVVPQDMGRVLLNLINNAFYAVDQRKRNMIAEQQKNHIILNDQDQNLSSPDSDTYKPTVTVSTKNIGQRIEISVSDNGEGIAEKIKDKIFQPFFTTKPTGQGTGLGLSLAYDIVKAHGGELKVETTAGEGARFTIILPV